MPTISIDVDGVLHRYSKGYHDGTLYDGPIDGALDGVRKLMDSYAVFLLSTREPKMIQAWMAKHAPDILTEIVWEAGEKPFWNKRGILGITNIKLAAMVYIDDRAYVFRDWKEVMTDAPKFAKWPHIGAKTNI